MGEGEVGHTLDKFVSAWTRRANLSRTNGRFSKFLQHSIISKEHKMKTSLIPTSLVLCAAAVAWSPMVFAQTNESEIKAPSLEHAEIRTPKAPVTPRI